jgi:hypothetical protein
MKYLLSILVLSAVISARAFLPFIAGFPPGAIISYKCGDGTGNVLSDSSGNAFNATLQNSPVFTNTAIGIGLNCNSASSQNAEFAYNAALAVCTNFTVDAWVFLNAYPAPGSSVQYGIVGTRQNGADDTFDFCFNRPSGQSMDFHGDIGNGSSWINNGIDMQPTNPPFFFPPLTNGVWYNVGYVVRQGICQIYFQGILVTNVPLAAGMPTFIKTGQSVQVGSCDLIGTYHNGIILDVGIWPRALLNSEMQTLNNGGVPPARQ